MAKTSAWREALDSALKHSETSPATSHSHNCSEGSLGAFSILIQQALEVCLEHFSCLPWYVLICSSTMSLSGWRIHPCNQADGES